jgi:membrane protease YdiL (CAAX protease family)
MHKEVFIGIIVLLAVSWLILWFVEKKNLSVLGLRPTPARLKQFGAGFIVMAIFCAINILLITLFGNYSWTVNDNYTFSGFLSGLLFTVSSVFGEELLFRGAILYILIRRVGLTRACVLSAIAFGIYHWFTYEAWNNLAQMIYIFILTGCAGFMFAYSYAKTNSLYLPIGLHLGWNFANILIFSNGPLGNQLLIFSKSDEMNLTTFHSLILLLFQAIVIPSVVLWYLGFFKKKKVAPAPGSRSKQRL